MLQIIYKSKFPRAVEKQFKISRHTYNQDYVRGWKEKVQVHYACTTKSWQTSATFNEYCKQLAIELEQEHPDTNAEFLLLCDNAPSQELDIYKSS